MAELAQVRELTIQASDALDSPRHTALVRITHWIHTVSFLALVVSGVAILLAHPRLYWGETGAVGAPSLIDLPLPFVLQLQIRGPGRYLHFLSAWVCVLTGLLYVLSGIFSRHFRMNMVPAKADLRWKALVRVVSNDLRLKRPAEEEAHSYNVVQRLTYLAVVFLLFPLIIVTGLAMSPAVTSVFPMLVTVFGGQQSARTVHFFVSVALVLFLVVHIAMVCLAGFKNRMRAMITGRVTAEKELA
jgi:thiosulfate reductase cytochrome b subunit